MDIKKLKAELKKKTDSHPENYYPVKALKKLGFSRKHCRCGRYFWSKNFDKVCGDCEGYTFIGKKIGKKLSYTNVAKTYAEFMKKKGYTPTKRYPVVARWRDDIDFVHAAINNYQPYVVSGEVQPPANPLTVIQPSLRFNDIDNVGITGRHYVLHGHVEQFTIQPKNKFDQEKYFNDLHAWLTIGLCIPENIIKYHEDAWGGGGNLGTSIEHFVGGLELGNQVYMTYEVHEDGSYTELKNKVLDMGAGQERYAWIISGEPDCYKVVMPEVCKKLYSATKVKQNAAIMKKYMPLAGNLNIDEVKDIEKAWVGVSKKIEISVEKLKKEIEPLTAIYSIADHTRALLIALADGALPSNVGGGYNLRFIFRRTYDFIEKYGWKLSIPEICKWHAEELKPQYPELVKSVKEVKTILEVEEKKYKETREKAAHFIERLKATGEKLNEQKLLELYDSQGISPDVLKIEGVIKSVPADFYSKIAALHEQKEQQAQTKRVQRFNLENIPETEKLFYSNKLTFSAKVLNVIDDFIVLDKTAFYPTSGGQLNDIGKLDNLDVHDVFKQEKHIIHFINHNKFKVGQIVNGEVDKHNRDLLKRHHTAVHIINGAARHVLGEHIWQSGSKVSPTHARLDITHFELLSDEEIKQIETLANKKIKEGIKVDKKVLPKDEAEKLYGFRLYQGGAIPGSTLRIVKIGSFDVEACAGTHVDNTREVEQIKITEVKKIQDGIVRLEFVASEAAKQFGEGVKDVSKACSDLLSCKLDNISGAAIVLRVKEEQLPNTLSRFIRETKEFENKLKIKDNFWNELKDKDLGDSTQLLFTRWKKLRKQITQY